MAHPNRIAITALGLSVLFSLILAIPATAQFERKSVRHGASFELPTNSIVAESNIYDLDAYNTVYGNFSIKVFPVKDFYGRDKKIMMWVDKYSRNRKMWKELDSTAQLILQQLTVLDNLNPVHSVETTFKKVGKWNAYSITFEKTTEAGPYCGECIGIIIPAKSIYIKAIHYMPKEFFDSEAQNVRKHFFESLKVK